jgi:hypothetical protein
MIRPILSVALAATLLAACGQKANEADNTKGPIVAASETPRNDAVNTTPATAELGPTAGANSFTEAQAKSAIEGAGYTNVSALTQDASGIWKGKATKAGKETAVAVDYKGAVTAS